MDVKDLSRRLFNKNFLTDALKEKRKVIKHIFGDLESVSSDSANRLNLKIKAEFLEREILKTHFSRERFLGSKFKNVSHKYFNWLLIEMAVNLDGC